MYTVKYQTDINDNIVKKNIQRLINQVWKLIPMKENEEDWERQLDTLILEIVGLYEIFEDPILLQIHSKLEGLKKVEKIDFEQYRTTVFKCISLLQELI